jgi:hypothetical protein
MQQGSRDPKPSDVLLAELTAYAAGVRAQVVTAHWADLTSGLGVDALAAKVDDLGKRGLTVVVVIDVVDRRVARRPEELAALAWDSPAAIAAVEKLAKSLVGAIGNKVAALVIGKNADVYVQSHPAEATGFASFASAALAAIAQSSDSAPRAGVGLTYSPTPSNTYTSLAALGTALVISYLPELGKASVAAAFTPAKDLDAMLAIANKRPVYLAELGFTSATSLSTTDDAQAQHLADFSAALQPRRSGFPVVNVARLHDLGASACAKYASEQKLAATDPEVIYICSAGLRHASGAAKKAWYAFLSASAAYAQP